MNLLAKSYSKKLLSLSTHGGDIRHVFMHGQKLIQENPNLKLIDLSLGNPDVEPPVEVDESIITLLQKKEKSSHRYMDSAGLPEVREFLSRELSKSEQIEIDKNSVFLTVGAAGGLQILLRTFLDKGDEAIIFSPFFPEYKPYILNFDGNPVICPCDENHFPDLEKFKNCITDKTKVIIINSPNNPSGVIYSEETLKEIFSILSHRFNSTGQIIHVISDEPYSRVTYTNTTFPKILSLYPFTWIVRSFSKDLCLAGERIGYIAWSKETLEKSPNILDIFRNASRILGFVCAPRLMQRLIPFIFHLRVDVSIYENRMKLFSDTLIKNGFKLAIPQAGFFAFPQSPIEDDRLFCNKLVEFGVLCVPGSGFGCPGYYRASLTQPIDIVEQAVERIVECCKSFYNQNLKAS